MKCLQVAANALGGEPLPVELPNSTYFVAGVAVGNSMCSDQWKAILMLIYVVNRNLPAIHPVAKVALGAILTAVNISVAVLASGSRLGKDRICVALLARHSRVHTSQRVRGPVVIEVGRVANRKPRRESMAILTIDLKWTVGISSRGERRDLLCEYRAPS